MTLSKYRLSDELMNAREATLTHLIQLATENKEISALWLYGSRAKGNHRVDSDYD